MIVDQCRSIATTVGGRREKLPRYGFGRWIDAIKAAEGRSRTCGWFPSHGKKEKWKAAHLPTSMCREFNRIADASAGEQLSIACRRRRYPQYLKDCEEAAKWASKAIEHWHRTAEDYIRNQPALVMLTQYWFGIPRDA